MEKVSRLLGLVYSFGVNEFIDNWSNGTIFFEKTVDLKNEPFGSCKIWLVPSRLTVYLKK